MSTARMKKRKYRKAMSGISRACMDSFEHIKNLPSMTERIFKVERCKK